MKAFGSWHFVVDSKRVYVPGPDEVTMEEVGQAAQLRAGELIIIVVVLVMWAGNVPPSAAQTYHCRPYRNPFLFGIK